jgi:hypothetical protein
MPDLLFGGIYLQIRPWSAPVTQIGKLLMLTMTTLMLMLILTLLMDANNDTDIKQSDNADANHEKVAYGVVQLQEGPFSINPKIV